MEPENNMASKQRPAYVSIFLIFRGIVVLFVTAIIAVILKTIKFLIELSEKTYAGSKHGPGVGDDPRFGNSKSGQKNRAQESQIGNVIPRGNNLYVYDDKGRHLWSITVGTGPQGGLIGYTSSTISVRRYGQIFTYDVRGRQISVMN